MSFSRVSASVSLVERSAASCSLLLASASVSLVERSAASASLSDSASLAVLSAASSPVSTVLPKGSSSSSIGSVL